MLRALNPYRARLFVDHDWHAVLILGAVVLTVTGGEALYADMGHFGKQPIRWGWFGFVPPALVLNYYGQGAVLLRHPRRGRQPVLHVDPGWAQVPMLVLATTAAMVRFVGGDHRRAFSVTRRAIQLGYLPRRRSNTHRATPSAQIYAVDQLDAVRGGGGVGAVVPQLGALATAYDPVGDRHHADRHPCCWRSSPTRAGRIPQMGAAAAACS